MYFLRRILGMAPLLVIVSLLAFVLIRMAPGGPFDRERKPASPEIERKIKEKFHLDEPTWKQYLRYVGLYYERDENGNFRRAGSGLLQGDLGPSYKYRDHTINDIVAQALPVSLTLGALAFLFAMVVGIPLGILTAVKRGQWTDHIGSFFAILAFCIPSVVIGPLLIMFFAVKIKLLPVAFWESPWHMILPTAALGLYFAGRISRLMREGMTEVLHANFVTTARAKGASETVIIFKHALRLAILPVVSYSGPLLADLLTGSFVVENIFQIPGIGVFMINSLFNRDYLMTVGLVLLYAILLLVLNLLVDLSYGVLDRRVRYD